MARDQGTSLFVKIVAGILLFLAAGVILYLYLWYNRP
jgi:hypothetical protein